VLLATAVVAAVATTHLEFGVAGSGARPAPRYLVIIVMDGFRPDYMTLAPMRHLHALMRSGTAYSRAWVGQLETETPTGHATIATGAYPRKHGVIGFVWRDPSGQNITWTPTDLKLLGSGAMEKLIESGGVPTISDELHQSFPGAKSASMSGEKYYASDAMGTGADYVLYGKTTPNSIAVTSIGVHRLPANVGVKRDAVKRVPEPIVQDQFVARLAVQLVRTIRPRMLLVNLPGTDIEGHRSGGVAGPGPMRVTVQGADKAIGRIMAAYKQAGLFGRTDFVVTADHGMLPNKHITHIKAMYAAVRATGAPTLEDDFLSTAGYVYLRNPDDAQHVAAGMVAKHFPYVEGAFYKIRTGSGYSFQADPTTARALGPQVTRAYIDLCDTIASFSGPDVVLPYAEDTLGLTVKGYGPHWGTHGGLSWRVQHIPLVISGPGVRHGVSTFPAQLVDIAPTVEHLMGLHIPGGVDGVVLSDALKAPSRQAITVQQRVSSPRSADVRALQAHSTHEGATVLERR
jgi:arylsulfatase A-like enzyme